MMSIRELSLKEKLARRPHFRALMESYWRYVDRHGMVPQNGTRELEDSSGGEYFGKEVGQMIVLALGRWNHKAGWFLVWDRLYWGGRWTPFCRIRMRYDSWWGYRG